MQPSDRVHWQAQTQFSSFLAYPNVQYSPVTTPTSTAVAAPGLMLASQRAPSSSMMRYVACHFSRSCLSQTWGLVISLLGDSFLMVDDVVKSRHLEQSVNYCDPEKKGTSSISLRWSWATAQQPNPCSLWNRSVNDEWTNHLLERYFVQLPLCHSTTRAILPGDCIVSVNGIPISAFGGSFAQIAEYMRLAHELLLVVARHSEAVESQTSAAVAAAEAHQIYRQVFPGGWPGRPTPNFNVAAAWLQHASIGTPKAFPGHWNRASSSSSNIPTPPPSLLYNCVPVLTPPPDNSQREIRSSPDGCTNHNRDYHPAPAVVTPPTTKRMKPSPPNTIASSSTKAMTATTLSSGRPSNAPRFPKTNPMFPGLAYDDNCIFDPYEGSQSALYVTEIDSGNFTDWLKTRKRQWRSKWKPHLTTTTATTSEVPGIPLIPSRSSSCGNHMFPCTTSSNGDGLSPEFLRYDDDWEFDPHDGFRSHEYLATIDSSNFADWLISRKQKWAKNWAVYHVGDGTEDRDSDHDETTDGPNDFWTSQGFPTFQHWLVTSKEKWVQSYSWNRKKRKRIQLACEAVVELPSSPGLPQAGAQFRRWLRVRKNQWLKLRRTRQRRMDDEHRMEEIIDPTVTDNHNIAHRHQSIREMMHIDALLEEEERKKKAMKARAPLDISFVFFPNLGCPDDVVAKILGYLEVAEHGKLLCISKAYSEGIQQRDLLWQQLCTPHGTLPRRPRKPWHKLYISKLKSENLAFRKRWDDLLSNVANVLLKGDQLKVVKKLVAKGEKDFNFTVDYSSGVVYERNSILNLAVIHQRHKVVKWLVEEKNADIESSDRGHFTPLLNAAWAGDKYLVRFLLQSGSDRAKIGTGHYTGALAHPDFKGHTAEGWAREKGHTDIAELIRIGL